MRLWGECIVCRRHVLWDGVKWKDPGRGKGTRHVCPTERPTCGAWMPQARERCARRPDHAGWHGSRYALDNAAAGRRRYNERVGASDTPTYAATGLLLAPVEAGRRRLARSKSA